MGARKQGQIVLWLQLPVTWVMTPSPSQRKLPGHRLELGSAEGSIRAEIWGSNNFLLPTASIRSFRMSVVLWIRLNSAPSASPCGDILGTVLEPRVFTAYLIRLSVLAVSCSPLTLDLVHCQHSAEKNLLRAASLTFTKGEFSCPVSRSKPCRSFTTSAVWHYVMSYLFNILSL